LEFEIYFGLGILGLGIFGLGVYSELGISSVGSENLKK